MFKKLLSVFIKPSPLKVARASLAHHEHQLLKNQEYVSFYQHEVNYNVERIEALKAYIDLAEGNAPKQAASAAKDKPARRSPAAALAAVNG